MPVKIIDFRSEESQSSTQHIHIQCLTIHSSSAPRRHHSTHTQQGRESSTAAYLVSQNIYLGDSQQGEGCPLVMLSLYVLCDAFLSHRQMNKKEIGGAIERTALTAIDTGTSTIHSTASAAVSFTHIKPTQRKFKG